MFFDLPRGDCGAAKPVDFGIVLISSHDITISRELLHRKGS